RAQGAGAQSVPLLLRKGLAPLTAATASNHQLKRKRGALLPGRPVSLDSHAVTQGAPYAPRRQCLSRTSENVEQLDIEYQHAVRRDAANALSAVGQLARHVQTPLAAGTHQLQSLDPARNHTTDREFSRLAALVGAVEHGAVDQGAVVMGTYLVLAGRLGALAGDQHFVLQAGRQHGHAFTLGVLGQVGTAFAGSGFSLGSRLGLHDFADDLEAGAQLGLGNTAGLAGEGVGQTGEDGVQVDAGRRVVAQLTTELTTDAVADAALIGGQIGAEVEFGHERLRLGL